ncbi:hypothetical protein SAMN05192563_1001323 [Paraburkholderia aspalathi]|uniref:Uncharacterized protein n=1 Tax=Paraburkholderia aspalathi TaxID=1324617 RepID=A0A1I6Y5W3_9BURK|nr:hypothetical protein SAMN05192563_1001323 [Paraburkholderia aspalathi]
MTKDGFMFLAMGFTGKEAGERGVANFGDTSYADPQNGQPHLTLSEIAVALYGKGGDQTAPPFRERCRKRGHQNDGPFA